MSDRRDQWQGFTAGHDPVPMLLPPSVVHSVLVRLSHRGPPLCGAQHWILGSGSGTPAQVVASHVAKPATAHTFVKRCIIAPS